MGDVLSPFTISSPPPPSTKNNSMPMLYYGLVVVGTAAIVLAIYNLVLLKRSQGRSTGPNPNPNPNPNGLGLIEGMNLENQQRHLPSSFKYKKEVVVGEEEQEDFECPVCLSVYEEGDEVRRLPQCKHYFHVLCIDMWLYSHFDCPICRTPVAGTLFPVDNSSPDRFMESGRISID